MHLDQEPHEHGHETGPRQDMRADDVEGEIREHDERHPFRDRELIGDLGMHLAMGVVRGVDAREEREAVEGDVDVEEERVVDEERRGELQDQLSTGGRERRQRTPRLKPRCR